MHEFPKGLVTALFLHRLKQSMSSKKEQNTGHPIIQQPIVVRPHVPVQKSNFPPGVYGL